MADLSAAELSLLQHLVRTDSDPRVRWRAQCLVLGATAPTVRAAAPLAGVAISTLHRWRNRFLNDGRDGLCDRPRRGRPVKLPAAAQRLLTTVLDELPTDHGYATATWTLADLQDLLARKGWSVAVTTVARSLHRLGYTYHRPKHDLQHRQDADSVATAQQTLRILQQKGGLTAQEFAWFTVMSATCTPIHTWRTAGNAADSAPSSPPPGSTSAAPSTAPSTTVPESCAGSMTSAPAQTDF